MMLLLRSREGGSSFDATPAGPSRDPASITCEPEDDPYLVTRPLVLFEILSPETEARDRGDKWQEHQTLPSLQHHVLIAQDEVRVEHHRRVESGWHYREVRGRDAALRLDPPGVVVPLVDLYEGVELPDHERAS